MASRAVLAQPELPRHWPQANAPTLGRFISADTIVPELLAS